MPASKKVVPEDNVNSGALETRKCSLSRGHLKGQKWGLSAYHDLVEMSEESSEAGCASINTWNILGQPGVMGHRLSSLCSNHTHSSSHRRREGRQRRTKK